MQRLEMEVRVMALDVSVSCPQMHLQSVVLDQAKMIRQNKDEKRQACSTKKQACPFYSVTGIVYSQCTWAEIGLDVSFSA